MVICFIIQNYLPYYFLFASGSFPTILGLCKSRRFHWPLAALVYGVCWTRSDCFFGHLLSLRECVCMCVYVVPFVCSTAVKIKYIFGANIGCSFPCWVQASDAACRTSERSLIFYTHIHTQIHSCTHTYTYVLVILGICNWIKLLIYGLYVPACPVLKIRKYGRTRIWDRVSCECSKHTD